MTDNKDAMEAVEALYDIAQEEYHDNEVIYQLRKTVRAALEPIKDDKRLIDVEELAEVIFKTHKYSMVGSWQEMKDRYIGEDKASNCWKSVHANCLNEAEHVMDYLAAQGHLRAVPDGYERICSTLACDSLKTLAHPQRAVPEWQPISSAPRDGSWFSGLIEGIPYKCKIVMNKGVVNYHWYMHTDMSSGDSYTRSTDEEGREVRTMLGIKGDPEYTPQVLAYKKGMNHKPTHWMPLPLPPKEGE